MRVTKRRLRRIIRETLDDSPPPPGRFGDAMIDKETGKVVGDMTDTEYDEWLDRYDKKERKRRVQRREMDMDRNPEKYSDHEHQDMVDDYNRADMGISRHNDRYRGMNENTPNGLKRILKKAINEYGKPGKVGYGTGNTLADFSDHIMNAVFNGLSAGHTPEDIQAFFEDRLGNGSQGVTNAWKAGLLEHRK